MTDSAHRNIKRFRSRLRPLKAWSHRDASSYFEPTECENFLARFSTFKKNFQNVLEYQNDSKIIKEPNLSYSTIWEKIFGVRKSREFLIFSSHWVRNWYNITFDWKWAFVWLSVVISNFQPTCLPLYVHVHFLLGP